MRPPDTFDNAAGSFAMNANADCLWSFTRVENSERILKVMGRDADHYSLVYKRGPDGKLAFVLDGPGAELELIKTDVLPPDWKPLPEGLKRGRYYDLYCATFDLIHGLEDLAGQIPLKVSLEASRVERK